MMEFYNDHKSDKGELFLPDVGGIANRISHSTDGLVSASKEKYDRKIRLIENAEDMTTQEKLDALDHSYDRHGLETFGTCIGGASLLAVAYDVFSGNFSIAKGIKRFFS